MVADPDPPPTAGNPPPFSGADVRISPSGPYVPILSSGLLRLGVDAVAQDIQLINTGVNFGAVARSTSPVAPLRITFPVWTPDSTLVVWWHLSGTMRVGNDPNPTSIIFQAVPSVDVGAGPEAVNNAHVIYGPAQAIVADAQSVSLAGIAAIKLANPTQPPVVELFYQLDGDGAPTPTIDIAGAAPTEGIGSCWIMAAELATGVVFQLPAETTLVPFT